MSVTGTSAGPASAAPQGTAPDDSDVVETVAVPRTVVAVALISAVLGAACRFMVDSPLWLDEALSVNIARLPIGDLAEALRHDGHPPLYYLLLHAWIALFGDGDSAVRALSGVLGLIGLGLVWWVGRRRGGMLLAWLALLVMAVSPFAIRYSTETRMYSLVMVEVLVGVLVLDALYRPSIPGDPRPKWTSWALLGGVVVVTAALLWTHYWSLWFLGAVGMRQIWIAWRDPSRERRDVARRTMAAMALGGLLFLPWVGVLTYQAAHTGTPWAPPFRPTSLLATTVADFGGGDYRDAQTVGWGLVLLAALGLFGRAVDRRHIDVDLRTVPDFRPEATVVTITLAIGSAVSIISGSAYAARYAAVVFPLFVLLVAGGLTRFRSTPVLVAIMALVALGGLAGGYDNARTDRSQARVIAAAITSEARAGDIVVFCPDQLGVSGRRELERAGVSDLVQVAYPGGEEPGFVDWVDYAQRNAAADPQAFAAALLEQADSKQVFLVSNPGYRTFEGQCSQLGSALSQERFAEELVVADGGQFFENAGLTVYRAQ